MPDPKAQSLSAWMMAIADHGWHGASLALAAQAAGLERAQVVRDIGDRFDALRALAEEAARAAFIAAAGEGSVRERLFDGLMAGLDVLQAERRAVLAVLHARDPGASLLVAGLVPAALRRVADAAGMDAQGLRGTVRMAGLAALVAALFRTWVKDDSPDMAATMAELDRLLERAEKAETDGISPALLGLPAFANPLAQAPAPAPDPRSE